MKITTPNSWLSTLFAKRRWLPAYEWLTKWGKGIIQLAYKWITSPSTCYVLKTILIVVYLIDYNFIYGFSDFSEERPPIREWDTAAYYIGAALFDLVFFLFALSKEKAADSFHFKSFCYLLLFAAFRLFFEIYTIIFGASINAKYVGSSLFFVTFMCIVLVALASGNKRKPKLK